MKIQRNKKFNSHITMGKRVVDPPRRFTPPPPSTTPTHLRFQERFTPRECTNSKFINPPPNL